MSNFLSNMLSRHTQNGNIVRPREKSLFETYQSFTEPFHPPADRAPVGSNESSIPKSTVPSESKETNTVPEKVMPDQLPKAQPFVQQDKKVFRGKREKPVAIPPPASLKTESKMSKEQVRIVEKLKLNAKALPDQQVKSKNEKLPLSKDVSDNSTIANLQNKFSDQQLIGKALPQKKQQPERQSTPSVFFDRITEKSERVISQQLLSKININHHSESNLKFNSTIDTSIMNQAPTIKIHIGRIDIKAVKQSPVTTSKVHKAQKPGMSLEQFLNKRNGKQQ